MKKNVCFNFIAFLCLTLFSLISFSNEFSANESNENQIGYHIYAIPAENQIGDKDSFFNLRMKPNQKQTIEFVIANTSDKDQSYQIGLNQAYTNEQGYIDYSKKQSNSIIDKRFSIDQLATVSKKITVPKQSTKKVPITLTMPVEEFDGEILAGIRVIKQEEKSEEKSITNEYGYILGLRLTETDKELKRAIKLKKIKPAVSFGKTSIVATLLNPVMESYGNLNYQVKIQNKKKPSITKEKSFTGLQLAPSSQYNFSVDWDGERIIAGDYRLKLTITDKKSNKWVFNKDFTIQSQEAAKVNKVVVGDTGYSINKLVIVLVLLVIAAGITLYIIWRKKSERS